MLQIFEQNRGCAEEVIAQLLASRAQELSLDTSIDSPFATLAKENDILWGGGRPDDITVIVSTVVDTSAEAAPPLFKAFTGPGTPPEWDVSQLEILNAKLDKRPNLETRQEGS